MASHMLFLIIGILVMWGIPIALVVWAVRTLIAIRRAQNEILMRLATLESQRRGT